MIPCIFPIHSSNPNPTYPKQKNGPTNFLYIYFLFSYYLGFSPFRFKYDQSTFTLHAWFPQKILCATVHTTVLLRYALEIKKTHYSLKPNDPIAYFELIERSSSFVCKLVAFHNFWMKKQVFFRIVKLLGDWSFPCFNPYKINSTAFLCTLCTFYMVVSVVRLLFDPIVVGSVDRSWYRGLLIESRYSYLFQTIDVNSESPTSLFDNILAVLTALNILFRIMAGFYLDLGILVCVISLWSPAVGFVNALNASVEKSRCLDLNSGQSCSVDFVGENSVLGQFKLLKCLSGLICEGIGGFLVPAVSEIAFGYAIDFEEAVLTFDPMRRFTNILFFCSTLSTFLFAAETCRKMSCVKTWLSVNENNLRMSRNELVMILDNIAHDEICVSAGGRFTINYSFVGTMVVVLVTFFVIRLQSELAASTT